MTAIKSHRQMQMQTLDAVVPIRGTFRGQVGMLHDDRRHPSDTVTVQFGAAGPMVQMRLIDLRHATEEEVIAQGKEGVGDLRYERDSKYNGRRGVEPDD